MIDLTFGSKIRNVEIEGQNVLNLKHMVNDFVLRSTLLNLKHIVNDFVFRSTQPDVFFNTSILKNFHKIPHKVSTFDFGIATD